MKKFICVLLSLSVIAVMFSGISATTFAHEDEHSHFVNVTEKVSSQNEDKVITAAYVNPIYKDVVSEEEILLHQSSLNAYSEVQASTGDYTDNLDVSGAAMRGYMKNRVETFTIYVKTTESPTVDLLHDIADIALIHTGVPTEGDYLAWQYKGWMGKISISSRGNVYYCDITYYIEYYTTYEQELIVDAAVKTLLNNEFSKGNSDYEKICKIYDYICSHVVYDYTNLNDESYTLKYTAYAALINKTSVCQGYALLLYRLSLELGVDCRIITGIGNGGNHGWNIVRLRDKYYNVDSTWDAGVNPSRYSYFLRCNANFIDHTRNAEYNTTSFNREYPMGTEDYKHGECTGSHRAGSIVIENEVAVTCTSNGSYDTVIYCADCGKEIQRTKVIIQSTGHSWSEWKVIKEATERENGTKERTCSVCGETETEIIPKTGRSLIGDINMDGVVNGMDSVIILQLNAGWEISDIDRTAADVNADGNINGIDATLMLQYLAGWFTEFPAA